MPSTSVAPFTRRETWAPSGMALLRSVAMMLFGRHQAANPASSTPRVGVGDGTAVKIGSGVAVVAGKAVGTGVEAAGGAAVSTGVDSGCAGAPLQAARSRAVIRIMKAKRNLFNMVEAFLITRILPL